MEFLQTEAEGEQRIALATGKFGVDANGNKFKEEKKKKKTKDDDDNKQRDS